MNILLAQLIPAGPGDNGEGWMNILFVVVLAVFWVISGIIKATSKKPQDSQKQPSRKLVHKVPPPTIARDPSTRMTPARSQPRPRPTTYAAELEELEKALRSKTVEATRKLESPPPKPKVEPILKDLPEFTSKPLVKLEPLRLDTPQQTSEVEDLPDLVLNYSDPDELSKAILQYEILGPPVSLRPSHQITGF